MKPWLCWGRTLAAVTGSTDHTRSVTAGRMTQPMTRRVVTWFQVAHPADTALDVRIREVVSTGARSNKLRALRNLARPAQAPAPEMPRPCAFDVNLHIARGRHERC
jgi:hypothetical protein